MLRVKIRNYFCGLNYKGNLMNAINAVMMNLLTKSVVPAMTSYSDAYLWS